MNRKRILAILLIVLAVNVIKGQDTDKEKNQNGLKNEFGIHAGATTGLGLSYRYWFDKAGVQLTAVPIKNGDYILFSGGLTFLYSFYESEYKRFFIYLGNHFWYHRNKTWNYSYTLQDSWIEERTYNVGIGPGFSFGRVVRINIMAGYGFYDLFGKQNMYPTGEIGLYYCF